MAGYVPKEYRRILDAQIAEMKMQDGTVESGFRPQPSPSSQHVSYTGKGIDASQQHLQSEPRRQDRLQYPLLDTRL